MTTTLWIVYALLGVLTFLGTALACYYYAPVKDPKDLRDHFVVGLISVAVGAIWIIALLFGLIGLSLFAMYKLAEYITKKIRD